ncbi:hypothetical protein FH972_024033 [Carpinus fangiana]|uniref:Aminoglycoside phosphotransferase domain-containing protein n=1 Tax=Carpinus fangiana TaxID=176857 RepID=A0A5N6KWV9_9ROSI|nr:hypothetical protein FH972_024033 [Carpinus fangiana]
MLLHSLVIIPSHYGVWDISIMTTVQRCIALCRERFTFGSIVYNRPLVRKMSSGKTLWVNVPQHEADPFEYTSGRWIFNEQVRRKERRLKFDVEALKTIVAASRDLASSAVISSRKFAEGGFNRIIELTFRDGEEVLARLPYPLLTPKHYAIASEAATLTLLRSEGIPVPKVLGYSASGANAVGSEYLLLEKVNGSCLGDICITMPASGSLYHLRDLQPEDSHVPLTSPDHVAQQLVIGPTCKHEWHYKERTYLREHLGPWKTFLECFEAPAKRELQWCKKYGQPRQHIQRHLRSLSNLEEISPDDYAETLRDYLKLAPSLDIPPDHVLSRPVLRHPDLSPNNILINENYDIVALIDWQHADEKGQVVEQLRRRLVHFLYAATTKAQIPDHFAAISQVGATTRARLYQHAAWPWVGDSLTLQHDLVLAAEAWPLPLKASPSGAGPVVPHEANCPLQYPAADLASHTRQWAKMQELEEEATDMRTAMDIDAQGSLFFGRRLADGAGSIDTPVLWLVERIESGVCHLCPDPQRQQAQDASRDAEQKASNRSGHECSESTPVPGIQPTFKKNEVGSILGVAIVDCAEDEHGQDAAQTANDDFKTTPPVAFTPESDEQHGNDGRADQVTDQIDLQNVRALEGHNDHRDNDQHNQTTNPPKRQPVAEKIIAGRADHGRLQAVERSGAECNNHDEGDADHPCGQPFQKVEECEVSIIAKAGVPCARPGCEQARRSDKHNDASHNGCGNGNTDPEVLVRLRGECSQPEPAEEHVVGQDRDGQNVDQLPAQQACFKIARACNLTRVNVCRCANTDGANDDHQNYQGALDVVGDERHFEATKRRIDGRHDALHDNDRQAVQARQQIDNLTHVMTLRYNEVKTPYRWRVHSVRTKPSGHFRRMIGPSAANASNGSEEDNRDSLGGSKREAAATRFPRKHYLGRVFAVLSQPCCGHLERTSCRRCTEEEEYKMVKLGTRSEAAQMQKGPIHGHAAQRPGERGVTNACKMAGADADAAAAAAAAAPAARRTFSLTRSDEIEGQWHTCVASACGTMGKILGLGLLSKRPGDYEACHTAMKLVHCAITGQIRIYWSFEGIAEVRDFFVVFRHANHLPRAFSGRSQVLLPHFRLSAKCESCRVAACRGRSQERVHLYITAATTVHPPPMLPFLLTQGLYVCCQQQHTFAAEELHGVKQTRWLPQDDKGPSRSDREPWRRNESKNPTRPRSGAASKVYKGHHEGDRIGRKDTHRSGTATRYTRHAPLVSEAFHLRSTHVARAHTNTAHMEALERPGLHAHLQVLQWSSLRQTGQSKGPGGRPSHAQQDVFRVCRSLRAVKQTTHESGEVEWEDVADTDGVADGQQKEIDEYVVLQQRIMRGEVEDWRIWGTVEPARWDEILTVVKQNSPGQVDEPAEKKDMYEQTAIGTLAVLLIPTPTAALCAASRYPWSTRLLSGGSSSSSPCHEQCSTAASSWMLTHTGITSCHARPSAKQRQMLAKAQKQQDSHVVVVVAGGGRGEGGGRSFLKAVDLDGLAVEGEAILLIGEKFLDVLALVALQLDHLAHLGVDDDGAIAGKLLLDDLENLLLVKLLGQALDRGQSLATITFCCAGVGQQMGVSDVRRHLEGGWAADKGRTGCGETYAGCGYECNSATALFRQYLHRPPRRGPWSSNSQSYSS